jgi:Fe-S cluster biogenesis protein NfuA
MSLDGRSDFRGCPEQRRNRMALIREKVEESLNRIRPFLEADGGNIELIDVVENSVKVKLQGACHGCPGAAMTLRFGVERILREDLPEFESLIVV